MRYSALVWVYFLIIFPLFGQTEFSDLALSGDEKLIFKVSVGELNGNNSWSHFVLDLKNNEMEALSFIPSRIQYLPQINRVQFQNRYGLFQLNANGAVEIISREAFLKGTPLDAGLTLPILTSPDGKWLLFQFPTDLVRGDLILYEVETKKSFTISAGQILSFRQVPARWSFDSQFFAYVREGNVYYYSLRQLRENRVPSEILRNLGRGSLTGIQWMEDGSLLLAQSQVIFRILPEEFFTLSLYGGLLRTWGIVARLPQAFDPNKDQFWLSPDNRWVLYSLGGRGLFLYPFNNLDFTLTTDFVTNYLPMPGGMQIHKAVWSKNRGALVLVSNLQDGKVVYQTLLIRPEEIKVLLGPQNQPILDILISPEGGSAAVVTQEGVSLFSTASWEKVKTIPHPMVSAAAWITEKKLVVGGVLSTKEYDVTSDAERLLFLGQLDRVGFIPGEGIGAIQGEQHFIWKSAGQWEKVERVVILPPVQVNTRNRVYTEDLAGGPYRNMIYARNLQSFGTRALLAFPSRNYEPFPERESMSGIDIFTNGSRLRARQVTLSLDAEVEDEGLSDALRALADWRFRTTVFINGEFLRRNPGAVRELSLSGHEVANMFIMSFNMGDPRFLIERDFIRRGLARLEDDYNALTGKELSLFWHTPGYFISSQVILGGKDANYQYVSRDIDLVARGRDVDTIRFLEQILLRKKPGSIIPLVLGLRDEKTGESVFKYLDVLLNALKVQGYRVVPVSTLRESLR
jgi:peptidoglycan/xylan/chitin deacetylase (PgdA/CDA1 family)